VKSNYTPEKKTYKNYNLRVKADKKEAAKKEK